MEVIINLDGGSPAAGSDALDFFEREEAVGGGLFVADVEGVLAVVEELEAAAEHAGDVGADLYVIFARGPGAEHGVVAEDVADVELEEVEAGGQLGDYGVGYVADFVLRVEEHGDEGRALERVDRDQLVEAGGEGGGEDRVGDGHRKTRD